MDLEQLYEKMLMKTPDNMDCSLPIIVEKDGERRIAWAHFTMTEKDGTLSAHIKKIFMVDDEDMEVVLDDEDVDVDLSIEDSDNPEDEPQIGNHEYIKKLGGLLKKFTKIAMTELLRIAVHNSMLVVYESIIHCCTNMNWSSILFSAKKDVPQIETDYSDKV